MNRPLTFRKLDPEKDKELVSGWLERDETHKALSLKFSDVIADGTEAYLVLDGDVPLMVLRRHLAERLAIQYNPDTSYRNAKAADQVINWIGQKAKESGALEVIIRPGGKAIKFTERLGFSEFSGKYLWLKSRLKSFSTLRRAKF